ncbi:YaiI/YqxD family protein [Bacillus sp. V59.32b]|uniref:YaiI/YqxD family protein n=1 Tax=Bacillus sp. V59.32b TaxID=1758642 RepID=UPI000E3ECBFB|nr:YaiI/YqxD family protein [Bacillus sp. V59.32b]RFU61861.1 YaiI/YqxD family protein [Bacillus sp. V59.32b]
MQKDVEFKQSTNRPKIYVDADACPVKDETLQCAKVHEVSVCFVASYKNMMNEHEGNWVYVDADKEAADLYIANAVSQGDVVITADIGLAGTLIGKRVYVISPRGKEYTEDNINTLLDIRYQSARLRRQGKHTKGPKAFTKQDRMNFINNLSKILSNHAGKSNSISN